MEKQKGHYGLPTAIAMIIGIVVGSGIFFKADDILLYTDGNVSLGVLVFCIGALSIVFGSLTLTELSVRTESHQRVVQGEGVSTPPLPVNPHPQRQKWDCDPPSGTP